MSNGASRRVMLSIADSYDAMAEWATLQDRWQRRAPRATASFSLARVRNHVCIADLASLEVVGPGFMSGDRPVSPPSIEAGEDADC